MDIFTRGTLARDCGKVWLIGCLAPLGLFSAGGYPRLSNRVLSALFHSVMALTEASLWSHPTDQQLRWNRLADRQALVADSLKMRCMRDREQTQFGHLPLEL